MTDCDEIHHYILGMADGLSTGIIRAFPNRFHRSARYGSGRPSQGAGPLAVGEAT